MGQESSDVDSRLEGLGRLTGGLAHDFNNLLTVIQGNLLALKDLPSVRVDPASAPLLGAALRATQRGAELTRSMLAFSRRQPLAPTAVDVHATLRNLLSMLRRTVDQRIRFVLDDASIALACFADPALLESTLLNLAVNACDAMPSGGTLRCAAERVRTIPIEGGEQIAEPLHEGGYVAISISDTGAGMAPEVLARAFEPFFTTKAVGRGTGLGLSAAYGFARQSHGAITLDSVLGRGTRVVVYLPCETRRPVVEAEEAVETFDLLGQLDVMLVEDDLEVMAVLLSYLRAFGCKVRAYASAEHALLALQREPPPRMLVSDVALGEGMNGLELAVRVRDLSPQTSVLLISGHASDPSDLGVDRSSRGWLAKPFSRDQLGKAMRDCLIV